MLKKLKASMGAGGAIIETDLIDPNAAPGGVIQGEARQSFAGDALTGSFDIGPGFKKDWNFDMKIPWETPFNVLDGKPLPGVRLGIETELEIERAVDKGELDAIKVTALPSQVAVHKAVERLGFRLKDSDLERGQIRGAMYPFYQELEYAPGEQDNAKLEELEISFVTNEHWMQVWVEADRRDTRFREGGDEHAGFRMPTSGKDFDIDSALRTTIDHLINRR